MPIPADNGNPKAERDAQNRRIDEVAFRGADVQKEVRFLAPEPKKKNIFGYTG